MSPNTPVDPGPLPLTGERTVPGISHENYWFRRHEAAYVFACGCVSGEVVLEVGCGEGYGANLLAETARRVVALDYDRQTIVHARARYHRAAFLRANLAALPLADSVVGVVVALQVIEHVWNQAEFLGQCRRVLRPGGLLLVTTPNRLTFSPGQNRPVNPFHSREFTATELVELIRHHGLEPGPVLGVFTGARLGALDAAYGSFAAAQLAAPPESWSSQLLRDVAGVTASDFTVARGDRAEIDTALDLVVLARRAN